MPQYLNLYGWINFYCMYMLQLVSSPIDGHLGLFNFLALRNSAGVNVSVHIFVWVSVFNCFEYIPRCRITGLFGNPIFNFFFFFFKFYFIFKLYITVLDLPNIKMNPPQVYMCSPSWTLFPPPSPFHPSGSSGAPAPSVQYHASILDWQLISYMIFYMFQCHSPKSSHPLPLPQSP